MEQYDLYKNIYLIDNYGLLKSIFLNLLINYDMTNLIYKI
jgi:hypothetical protein